MALAGYSGTPLIKKLGLKEGLKLQLVNAPADYFAWLEKDVSGQLCLPGAVPDWVHVFAVSRKDFEREMKALAAVWRKNPQVAIWVSWYKEEFGQIDGSHGRRDPGLCAGQRTGGHQSMCR